MGTEEKIPTIESTVASQEKIISSIFSKLVDLKSARMKFQGLETDKGNVSELKELSKSVLGRLIQNTSSLVEFEKFLEDERQSLGELIGY